MNLKEEKQDQKLLLKILGAGGDRLESDLQEVQDEMNSTSRTWMKTG